MTSDRIHVHRFHSFEQYQAEICRFTVIPFNANRVLTLTETNRFREMSKIIGGEPLRLAVAFHELRNAIGRLRFGNRPVLLFTPRSVECGAYRLDGLDQFNWGFGFDANVEGIISVIDELAMNRMTVDFSEEGERQMVEIDVVGPDWINQDR